jgi:hypothetical protein
MCFIITEWIKFPEEFYIKFLGSAELSPFLCLCTASPERLLHKLHGPPESRYSWKHEFLRELKQIDRFLRSFKAQELPRLLLKHCRRRRKFTLPPQRGAPDNKPQWNWYHNGCQTA